MFHNKFGDSTGLMNEDKNNKEVESISSNFQSDLTQRHLTDNCVDNYKHDEVVVFGLR